MELGTLSLGVLVCPWPQSILYPLGVVHHTQVQPGTSHRGHHILLWQGGRWCCTARLGGGSSWGCWQGGLAATSGHTACPSQLCSRWKQQHFSSRSNTSSLVTCSPVFEFLCCHGPCRTGSQCSQLSGWWLTQQPMLWHVQIYFSFSYCFFGFFFLIIVGSGVFCCCCAPPAHAPGLARTRQMCLAPPGLPFHSKEGSSSPASSCCITTDLDKAWWQMLPQALELRLQKLQKTVFMKSFMVGFISPDFLLPKADLD